MTVRRAAWFALGILSLGLGALGVVLPLLPTTPFVLLAAYAFARSSKRWHDWLMKHRLFGPLIRNWQAYGAIGRRAKISAMAALAVVVVISVALRVPLPWLAVQLVALAAVAAFILSRPSPPDRTPGD